MGRRSIWRPDREEAVATRGMVAGMHPLAVKAGLEVLRAGGNAVDAGVAVGFASCVVEPMMTSLAGGGFLLVYLREEGRAWAVEFPFVAPRQAHPEMYRVLEGAPVGPSTLGFYPVEGQENELGYRACAVPGLVAGLCLAHRKWGRLPLSEVLAPAVDLAEKGFPVNWHLALAIGNHARDLARFPASRALFLPDGFPPKYWPEPDRLVQRDLAQVLREIARRGPDAFHRGEVARALAEDMARNGGLITYEDLAGYEPRIVEPRAVRYRRYTVLGTRLPNGAFTIQQTLRLLEGFDLRGMGHNTPAYLHTLIECARHAFADRYAYLGDPDFVPVPVRGLLAEAYLQALRAQVAPDRAGVEPLLAGEQPWTYFARRPLHDPWPYEPAPPPAQIPTPGPAGEEECTTHFNVVDGEGNFLACTETAVSLFGSKVVTPGLGVLWNNAMVQFYPKPGHANSIAPGKRPLSNMSTTLVLRDGQPVAVLGAPGGRRIVSTVLQVLLNLLEFGMTPQPAITAPQVDVSTAETLVDERIGEETAGALARMGHRVRVVENGPGASYFARPTAIWRDPDTGLLRAGADLYSPAVAEGLD